MSNPVYFSASDRQLESYLDKKSFSQSLVKNICFQDSVLIPDIFFFISGPLAEHLHSSSQLTLLEAGIIEGEILPAFRVKGTSNFSDALKIIRKVPIRGVREDAEDTARRLDRAISSKTKIQPWPDWHVGERYAETLRKHLMADSPPAIDESVVNRDIVKKLWECTERWRIDCVEEAVLFARENDKGLRGTLMAAVLKSLKGGTLSDIEVDDVNQLFTAASDDERFFLHFFCRWMTDCYQYNQATEFGAIPNFPEFDPLDCLMVQSFYPNREAATGTGTGNLEIDVDLPPIELLQKLDPKELIARKHNYGCAYLCDLELWQSGNVEDEKDLRNNLHKYATDLSKWACKEENARTDPLSVVVSKLPKIDPAILAAGATTAATIAGEVSIYVPCFVAIRGFGYALYRWRKKRLTKQKVEIGRKADVNLPNNKS
jgi:hypothetical protein